MNSAAGVDAAQARALLGDVSLGLSLFAVDPRGTGLLLRGGICPLRERMLERLGALLMTVEAQCASGGGDPVADGPVADGSVADGTVADGTVADGTVADGTVTDCPVADGRAADLPLLGASRVREPWRRVPLGISDDRLLGGLDLSATLASGRRVTAPGVLAEADGGVVLLPLVEQMPAAHVAQICAALDDGRVRLAREGVTGELPARIGVIALDEGVEADERCAPSLADRLLLQLQVPAVSGLVDDFEDLELARTEEVSAARRRFPDVHVPDTLIESACAAALALGVPSLRAARGTVHVARLLAALLGEDAVDEEVLAVAARLVLAPRATRVPASPEEEDEDQGDPEPPSEAEDEAPDQPPENGRAPPDDTPELDLGPDTELLVAAAAAAMQANLLASLAAGSMRSSAARRAGRAGAEAKGVARGRPAGVRQGAPRRGERLSVVDTLRAAAPWQRLRGREGPDDSVKVRAEDFRVVRRRARLPTLTIFVVDASGSAAVQRLAEAKGAVELLLADCYVRRDEVAVVGFRGASAETLLPPTRSLLRARRSVAGLPGGGGTPLAAGLVQAQMLATDAARRGATPVLVLLTDGRANVRLDGEGDRRGAIEEALRVARSIAQLGHPAVVIDTSRRPGPAAAELAAALGAVYKPLPAADASSVSAAVRAVQTQADRS